MSEELDADDYQPRPPSAQEVAARALCLAVVSCRGILELEPEREQAARFWSRVDGWWNESPARAHLEAGEAELLSTPFGQASQQSLVNASWRSEALVVLAWALGRSELAPHDSQVDPSAVASSLGFLKEHTVLDSPSLRSAEELAEYASVALTIHWRLRQYSIEPKLIDFAKFCENSWFGPLSLRGVRLVDGDLAIGEHSIARAPEGLRRMASSIAQERHQAANWLLDATESLSDTDTST